jgi:uncharacterized membrane protein
MTNWKKWITIFILLCLYDAIMIGFVFRSIWAAAIKKVQGGDDFKPRLSYGLVTYVLLTIGIVTFVLPHVHSVQDCIKWGALFGLVVYGVFDTTNAAMFKNYPMSLVIMNILWGMILSILVLLSAYRLV